MRYTYGGDMQLERVYRSHASLINTTLLQTRQPRPGHGSPELDVFGLKAGSATYGGAALENLASVARAIGL